MLKFDSDGIEVTNNTAMLEVGTLLPFASGGGILIDFAGSQIDYPFNNTVKISRGKFISNTAQLGGGLAVDVVYDSYGCAGTPPQVQVVSSQCSFVR